MVNEKIRFFFGCIFIIKIQQVEEDLPMGGLEQCIVKLDKLVSSIKESATSRELPCVDMYAHFQDKHGRIREGYYLDDGMHLNKQGHAFMAHRIAGFLSSEFGFSD